MAREGTPKPTVHEEPRSSWAYDKGQVGEWARGGWQGDMVEIEQLAKAKFVEAGCSHE